MLTTATILYNPTITPRTMDQKPDEELRRRQDLESELLAHLKMRCPIHRTTLHSRFDPYMTGKLNPVLLDLEVRGLIEHVPDKMVTITASGLAELDKRRGL
jgi:DNA-binding PadR family transcriptional regulator